MMIEVKTPGGIGHINTSKVLAVLPVTDTKGAPLIGTCALAMEYGVQMPLSESAASVVKKINDADPRVKRLAYFAKLEEQEAQAEAAAKDTMAHAKG